MSNLPNVKVLECHTKIESALRCSLVKIAMKTTNQRYLRTNVYLDPNSHQVHCYVRMTLRVLLHSTFFRFGLHCVFFFCDWCTTVQTWCVMSWVSAWHIIAFGFQPQKFAGYNSTVITYDVWLCAWCAAACYKNVLHGTCTCNCMVPGCTFSYDPWTTYNCWSNTDTPAHDKCTPHQGHEGFFIWYENIWKPCHTQDGDTCRPPTDGSGTLQVAVQPMVVGMPSLVPFPQADRPPASLAGSWSIAMFHRQVLEQPAVTTSSGACCWHWCSCLLGTAWTSSSGSKTGDNQGGNAGGRQWWLENRQWWPWQCRTSWRKWSVLKNWWQWPRQCTQVKKLRDPSIEW